MKFFLKNICSIVMLLVALPVAAQIKAAPLVADKAPVEATPKIDVTAVWTLDGASYTSHVIRVSHDVQAGAETGKRMHKPYVITKDVDKSSPLLSKLMASHQAGTLAVITAEARYPRPGNNKVTRASLHNFYVMKIVPLSPTTEEVTIDCDNVQVTGDNIIGLEDKDFWNKN